MVSLFKQWNKRKIFCIGLHKTGTTSLHEMAIKNGFKAIHSIEWMYNYEDLKKFNFFSDGGSHFDDINEIDFEYLYYKFPNSRFILQTRNTRDWVISKCKHAGWHSSTEIEKDDINKINHNDWEYKSLLTVRKYVEHKINYEKKVENFFRQNDNSRLIKINITNQKSSNGDLERLVKFLKLKKGIINLPHSNKSSEKKMPNELIKFIDSILKEIYTSEQQI